MQKTCPHTLLATTGARATSRHTQHDQSTSCKSSPPAAPPGENDRENAAELIAAAVFDSVTSWCTRAVNSKSACRPVILAPHLGQSGRVRHCLAPQTWWPQGASRNAGVSPSAQFWRHTGQLPIPPTARGSSRVLSTKEESACAAAGAVVGGEMTTGRTKLRVATSCVGDAADVAARVRATGVRAAAEEEDSF